MNEFYSKDKKKKKKNRAAERETKVIFIKFNIKSFGRYFSTNSFQASKSLV